MAILEKTQRGTGSTSTDAVTMAGGEGHLILNCCSPSSMMATKMDILLQGCVNLGCSLTQKQQVAYYALTRQCDCRIRFCLFDTCAQRMKMNKLAACNCITMKLNVPQSVEQEDRFLQTLSEHHARSRVVFTCTIVRSVTTFPRLAIKFCTAVRSLFSYPVTFCVWQPNIVANPSWFFHYSSLE